jgi:hypothetical protein
MAVDINSAITGAAAGSAWGPTGALIGGGIGLLGGMLGAGAAEGDRERGYELTQEMLREISNLSVPDRESLVAHLARYSSAGKLDPRVEEAILMGPSAIETTASDPRLVAQQQSNLQEMQKIADAGGYDPAVKADLMDALRRQEQATKANQDALRMQAEAKGMASAGATQALQQMASQSEANRTADIQAKLAAAAYQNRLAALSGASGEAGRLRSSDYQEQMDKARARDLINEFNTKTRQGVETRTVDVKNRAAERDLNTAQDIANRNVGLTNVEEESRIGSYKDKYDMDKAKLELRTGAARTASQGATERGNRTASQIQGAAEGLAGIAANLGRAKGALSNAQNAWDNRSGEEIDADIAAGKSRPDSIWSTK